MTSCVLSAYPKPSVATVTAVYLPQKASLTHFDPTSSLSASDAADATSLSAKKELDEKLAIQDENFLQILRQNLTSVADVHRSVAAAADQEKAQLLRDAPSTASYVASKCKAELRMKVDPDALKLHQLRLSEAAATASSPDTAATDTDSLSLSDDSPKSPLVDEETMEALRRGYRVVASTEVWSCPSVEEADALILRAHTFFPPTFSAITSGSGMGNGSVSAASFAAFRAFLTGVVWKDCDYVETRSDKSPDASASKINKNKKKKSETVVTESASTESSTWSTSKGKGVTAVLLVAHVKPLAEQTAAEEEQQQERGKEGHGGGEGEEECSSSVVIEEAVFLTAVQTLRECMPPAYTLRQVASSDGRYVRTLLRMSSWNLFWPLCYRPTPYDNILLHVFYLYFCFGLCA